MKRRGPRLANGSGGFNKTCIISSGDVKTKTIIDEEGGCDPNSVEFGVDVMETNRSNCWWLSANMTDPNVYKH